LNVVLKTDPRQPFGQDRSMYKGTLINDLWSAVEAAAEKARGAAAKGARHSSPEPQAFVRSNFCNNSRTKNEDSESEQFPQTLRLSPADWNLCLLLVVHAQLERTLEPGHHFADAVDVHQVRPMRPPEKFGV
jgi:hypothetical protein